MTRRLLVVSALLLLWAAPAQAFSKQSGTRAMDDGAQLAYDLYLPDGTAPVAGWPGVIVLHGLGGSKDDVAPVAEAFADDGFAALAYTARGEGTSTGDLTLAGPREIADERAMFDWFAGLPQVSDTQIGAWGVSYGGGQIWNGLAAGIPYKAVDVVATWTNLATALWPQGIARSGIVVGFAKSVESRSPLIQQVEAAAVDSTDPAEIDALSAPRSAFSALSRISTPVYLFQGRVDWAFDVSQATDAFTRLRGPEHLYVGQFGHPPSTFTTPDFAGYVIPQSVAWLAHYVRGDANGIDRTPAVTIAAASGTKRVSFATLPRTKPLTVRVGARLARSVETFGAGVVTVRVRKVSRYPRLVAVVRAGSRIVTHGAIRPTVGLDTIRLANYVQYLPKGTRLTVTLGPDGGSDYAYLGFASSGGSISLGAPTLRLQTLPAPISGP